MKEEMIYVALPIQKGPELVGYIRLARPLSDVRKTIEEFTAILLQSFLIILVSSVVVAFLFSRKLTTPIRDMEHFTERLRRGETPGTLMIRSSDEIGLLAENINYMVDELQKRIAALQEEKAKVEAAFSSALDGVLILDHQGRIETVNRGMWAMIGERYRDIVGKTPLEAFRNLGLQKALDQYRISGMPVSQEIELGEDEPVMLDVSITPVRGVDAAEGKTMLVFHDVTRLKKLERMRVDFVANVTHEIKTPLTAILGYVETLQEGAIEDRETAKKFLSTIARHAERLNRLVEDLLTISNIELGEMRFCFESVSLSGDRRERPAHHPAEGPGEKNRDRLGDPRGSAADPRRPGPPEPGPDQCPGQRRQVHPRRRNGDPLAASTAAGNEVVVKIADTGIGVPRDEISRLGERFYRVDKTRSRELGGTGLGLSIVKHLMTAHKGRIEIESQLGRGTTVSLYFPAA